MAGVNLNDVLRTDLDVVPIHDLTLKCLLSNTGFLK